MEIRKRDAGVIIRGTVKSGGAAVDVSTATVRFLFVGPAGQTLFRAATFTTTGVDGQVEYTTTAADFVVVGTWTAQIRAAFPTGLDVRSAPVDLVVQSAPA
jgi:hypothetical protein